MRNAAVLFPGQGSQYVGMGKKIHEHYLAARQVFEEASDSLQLDMRKLCFEESSGELAKTENTQPAVLTVGVAAFRVFMGQTGLEPEYLAGHSLGEITALVCANSIKFADAVKLVRIRGKYMQEATMADFGAMLAVNGIDSCLVKEECDKASKKGDAVVVSNYNSPLQTVISGNRKAVEAAGKALASKGAGLVPLNVSAPFHSPFMKQAAERLHAHLADLSFIKPEYPVVSNITAFPYINESFIPDMLTSQMLRPVQWVKSMKFLQQQGIETFIDIGPNDVLKSLAIKNIENANILSFDKDEETIDRLNERGNKGTPMEGEGKTGYVFIERCLAIAVCTPDNNSDEYSGESTYTCRGIKQLLAGLESGSAIPEIAQMKQSLDMLCNVFRIKNTPVQEQKNRLEVLLEETGTANLFGNYILLLSDE